MYQPFQITFFGSTESLNKVSKQSMYYQAIDSLTTFNYGSVSPLNGKSFKSKEKGLTEPSKFLSKRIKSQEIDNFNIDIAGLSYTRTGEAKES